MKTSNLIDLLATEAGPAPRAVVARRFTPVVPFGLLASIAATLVLLGPIPANLWAEPAPWIKLAYAGGLATGALWLTTRLARPVARTDGPVISVTVVVVLMALLALATLVALPASERLAALLGHSWTRCPVNVLLLSLPTLAGAVWALRGLAPTKARAAGMAAGLLAGAVGAFAYALSCTELSAAFVAVWYSLGIALAGGLGALIGPRMLRW
ncbi:MULTISPECIES: DUF1109 domain-containing protein [Thiorhodovibrio]|uniref:DUF1109 domain-containing protein n=1 Tax=Thiorhodovibrio TaxID=61593 RepID=UPI001912F0CC|nr:MULTISPECIES: DUF1109 domain-containing protein [Thiorhodovibrio]MBK5969490.1 hypothetical protein [Thiorhodovibrio winogradskyi]WPL12381.1 hypothetical protein Thiosp_02145 [Thiorhodovibrio litoralis]